MAKLFLQSVVVIVPSPRASMQACQSLQNPLLARLNARANFWQNRLARPDSRPRLLAIRRHAHPRRTARRLDRRDRRRVHPNHQSRRRTRHQFLRHRRHVRLGPQRGTSRPGIETTPRPSLSGQQGRLRTRQCGATARSTNPAITSFKPATPASAASRPTTSISTNATSGKPSAGQNFSTPSTPFSVRVRFVIMESPPTSLPSSNNSMNAATSPPSKANYNLLDRRAEKEILPYSPVARHRLHRARPARPRPAFR